MKRILPLIFAILVVSCAPVTTETSEVLPSPVSPTVEKMATFTATPTSTPVSTTTPEGTAIVEIDLKPNYEQEVSREFMGVKINASLITDKSLDLVITKVTVGGEAYAEFIARSIYTVWLSKGGIDGKGLIEDVTFEQFMELWTTAQKSEREEDWRRVQVKNISANDLATNGYDQSYYDIWFMYDGKTPEDIIGVGKFSVAIVKGNKVQNITTSKDSIAGHSTNLFGSTMFFYHSPLPGFYHASAIASGIASLSKWLVTNTPGTKFYDGGGPLNRSLTDLLFISGGLQVH